MLVQTTKGWEEYTSITSNYAKIFQLPHKHFRWTFQKITTFDKG